MEQIIIKHYTNYKIICFRINITKLFVTLSYNDNSRLWLSVSSLYKVILTSVSGYLTFGYIPADVLRKKQTIPKTLNSSYQVKIVVS